MNLLDHEYALDFLEEPNLYMLCILGIQPQIAPAKRSYQLGPLISQHQSALTDIYGKPQASVKRLLSKNLPMVDA